MPLTRLAAHGPMIEDDKHGTYYRCLDADSVIATLQRENKQREDTIDELRTEVMALEGLLAMCEAMNDDPVGGASK